MKLKRSAQRLDSPPNWTSFPVIVPARGAGSAGCGAEVLAALSFALPSLAGSKVCAWKPWVPGIRKHPKWGAPGKPGAGITANGKRLERRAETRAPRIPGTQSWADLLAGVWAPPVTG